MKLSPETEVHPLAQSTKQNDNAHTINFKQEYIALRHYPLCIVIADIYVFFFCFRVGVTTIDTSTYLLHVYRRHRSLSTHGATVLFTRKYMSTLSKYAQHCTDTCNFSLDWSIA